MKSKFFVLLLSLISLCTLYADEAPQESPIADTSTKSLDPGWWPVLQIVLWPGMPPYTDMEVYGIRTGFPVSGGTGAVDGLEIAPLVSYSDYVNGLQFSPVLNRTKNTTGFRCGLVNTSTERVRGFQLSVFNYNDADSNSLDIAALMNYTSNYIKGIQISPIANYAAKSGWQIGLYNQSKTNAFQIGLINIIEEGYIPFFPVINFW